MADSVNHPEHYGGGDGDVPHEVWKCLNAWGLESDALLWNVVKYVARAGRKGSTLEDLRKAQWYLNKRIELMEKRESESLPKTLFTTQDLENRPLYLVLDQSMPLPWESGSMSAGGAGTTFGRIANGEAHTRDHARSLVVAASAAKES